MSMVENQLTKNKYKGWIKKVLYENEYELNDESKCNEIVDRIITKTDSLDYFNEFESPVLVLKGNLSSNKIIKTINETIDQMFLRNEFIFSVKESKLKTLAGGDREKLDELKAKKDKDKKHNILLIWFVDSIENKVKLHKLYNDAREKKSLADGYNKIKFSLAVVTTGMSSLKGYSPSLKVDRIDIQRFEENPKYMPFLEHDDNDGDIVSGYTINAKLIDLINIYNKVGDVLFQRNVRFGIADTMDVEKYMSKTLQEAPEYFWYHNNGISIALFNKDFVFNKYNEIVLQRDCSNELLFSVINGAQTIGASARYYYELKERASSETNVEEKGNLERIIKNIEDKAKVLTRIICVKAESQQIDSITVALNRQKPIRQEDMAYTLPIISEINDYVADKKVCDFDDEHRFRIVKRGEENTIPDKRCMSPFIFGKIMATCNYLPSVARNHSVSTLLRYDGNSFVEEFLQFSDDEQSKKDKVFKNKLAAVWFVFDYAKFLESDSEVKKSEFCSVIQNMKWTIISTYLFDKNEGAKDFESFDVKYDEDELRKFAFKCATYIKADIDKVVKTDGVDAVTTIYKKDIEFSNLKSKIKAKTF